MRVKIARSLGAAPATVTAQYLAGLMKNATTNSAAKLRESEKWLKIIEGKGLQASELYVRHMMVAGAAALALQDVSESDGYTAKIAAWTMAISGQDIFPDQTRRS